MKRVGRVAGSDTRRRRRAVYNRARYETISNRITNGGTSRCRDAARKETTHKQKARDRERRNELPKLSGRNQIN